MADSTADLAVEILRQIRDQLAKTDERVEKLGTQVATLGNQVETLGNQQAETNELMKVLVGSHSKLNEKVEATNARLDRLTGEIVKSRTHDAARFLDHDERLARIEKHLGLQGH